MANEMQRFGKKKFFNQKVNEKFEEETRRNRE